jgi:hypothetical protein
MDGNFKADHMKMAKSGNDVRLTDGEGYFVANPRYQFHLQHAAESVQVGHFLGIQSI